jgi:histidinol phosphatase-like PHP family hydrolase
MVEAGRIDLHIHTLLSDGVLLPSELLRRVTALGYEAVAITDHVDAGNVAQVVEALHRLRSAQPADFLPFLIGVEITHVAPASIAAVAQQAKRCGAELVVVHGETPVEPVAPGTNRVALDCADVDMLAHPGFLTPEEARRATARGCYVEITSRQGHSLTNGHVARVCLEAGAAMVVNTDAHAPSDLITLEFARHVALGAGLAEESARASTETHPRDLVRRLLRSGG